MVKSVGCAAYRPDNRENQATMSKAKNVLDELKSHAVDLC